MSSMVERKEEAMATRSCQTHLDSQGSASVLASFPTWKRMHQEEAVSLFFGPPAWAIIDLVLCCAAQRRSSWKIARWSER